MGNKALQQLETRLARAGYRATLPRRAVLEQIAARRESFTASDLLESVTRAAPEVGRATVFRTLDLLVELGVLQRIHTEVGGNWGHRYMLCALGDTHHHHLVCTGCGQVTDFSGCMVESVVSRLEDQTSFRVEGHRLELYGQCKGCQEEAR
jgi:Fur family ferric uptake transcriptional regulator